jgi:hypothetical protein
MKNPEEHQIDSYLRTFAIAILIVSLILAGKNTPPNTDKPPSKSPVHSIRNHDLQVGNA